MKKLLSLGFMLSVLCLTACQKENFSIVGEYTLEEGFTLSFDDGQLEIHFDQVLDDSRCPKNVLCAVAGSINIQLVITENGRTTYLESGQFFDESVNDLELRSAYGIHQIHIRNVTPYPDFNVSSPAPYQLILEIRE